MRRSQVIEKRKSASPQPPPRQGATASGNGKRACEDVNGAAAPSPRNARTDVKTWLCTVCENVNAGILEQCTDCGAFMVHDVSQADLSDAFLAVDDAVDEQGSFRVPDHKSPRLESYASAPQPPDPKTRCTDAERNAIAKFVAWLSPELAPVAIEAIQSRFAKEARSSEGGSGSASGKRGASASPAGSSPSQPEIVPDKTARDVKKEGRVKVEKLERPPTAPKLAGRAASVSPSLPVPDDPLSLSLGGHLAAESQVQPAMPYVRVTALKSKPAATVPPKTAPAKQHQQPEPVAAAAMPSSPRDAKRHKKASLAEELTVLGDNSVALHHAAGSGDGDNDANDVAVVRPLHFHADGACVLRPFVVTAEHAVTVRRAIKAYRETTHDYTIDDPLISSVHCTIRYDADMDKYFVKDVSSNGTRVNGRKLEKDSEHAIKVGDRVTFASAANAFVIRDEPPAARTTVVVVDASRPAGAAKPDSVPSATPPPKHAASARGKSAHVLMSIDEEESLGAADRSKKGNGKGTMAKRNINEDDDDLFGRLV